MNIKLSLFGIAIISLVAGVVHLTFKHKWSDDGGASEKVATTSKHSTDVRRASQQKSVSMALNGETTIQTDPNAETLKRVRSSLDLHADYKALLSKNDPASLGLKGLLVEYCAAARYVEKNRRNYPPPIGPQSISGTAYYEIRKQYNKQLVNSTPQKVCAGFPDAELDVEAAQRNILAAAEGGDHRSIARRLGKSVIEQSAPLTNVALPNFKVDPDLILDNTNYGRALSARDFKNLKSALATKEPTTILMAGPLLTAAFRETSVQFGADGQRADSNVAHFLWDGVACTFASTCAAENFDRIQRGCVLGNQCEAVDYDDYLQRYIFSAKEFSEYQYFRQLLIRAISTNDWRGISLVASNNPFPIGGSIPRKPLPPRIR